MADFRVIRVPYHLYENHASRPFWAAFFMPGTLMLLLLAYLALPPAPADRDPRCNTAARYEAMAEGADCFNPPARPAKRHHKDRK